jgi:hypothetical protein
VSVFRTHHSKGFTILGNALLQDERLSYRARGLLTSLLSRPPEWTARSDQLADESPREGRDAIRAALRELEEVGYIVRRRERDEQGRVRTVTDVYDVPQGQTGDGLPGAGDPGSESTRRDTSSLQVAPETDLPEDGKPGALKRTEVERTKEGSRMREQRQNQGAHAELLDALPPNERQALIAQAIAGHPLLRAVKAPKDSPMVRAEALRLLDERRRLSA